MAHVSVKDAVGFSFSFLFRNVAQIAARIALPAMAGWIIFYVTFFLYLMELERYLGDPNDRIASLVLGLATAGLLATLFMHSIIVSSIVSLALGLKEAGWKYFRIGRPAWRLYAADLRFVLIGTAFIFAIISNCWRVMSRRRFPSLRAAKSSNGRMAILINVRRHSSVSITASTTTA